MFVYLFLIAAIASTELPIATGEDKELQEIIAILMEEASAETLAENDTPKIMATEKPAATTLITITNAIDADMLKYKHWTGTYSPETFTININGTEVAQGAQHTLPAETKTIDVMFTYSFMNGMRTGTKTTSYQLHENITQAQITFSWKEDHKVLVDNGTLLKITTS
jgi:hypothetical protein